jgi:predicted nucleic-acid-binding Zn-ribbon protein
MQAQGQRAFAWLNSHWTNPHFCPICSSNNWQIGNVFELRTFNTGALVIGGPQPIFPVFPVTCNVCGFTYFFNAVVAGVVPGATAQQTKQPQDPE